MKEKNFRDESMNYQILNFIKWKKGVLIYWKLHYKLFDKKSIFIIFFP